MINMTENETEKYQHPSPELPEKGNKTGRSVQSSLPREEGEVGISEFFVQP